MLHGQLLIRYGCSLLYLIAATGFAGQANPFFEIMVVDAATSRGVPLVELETVNCVRTLTDSSGRAAILEPGLEGQRVWFKVTSHGYEYPKDGMGFAGFAAEVRAGGFIQIALKRINIAERLYRVTGEGIYRDSVLLGHQTPLRQPLLAGRVLGQDSVMALPYRDKLYWFWGDTLRPSYPLGHFRTAGATSQLPGKDGLDPARGVDLEYFVDQDGFSRPMVPMPEDKDGAIWIGGLAVVPDATGRPIMIGAYSRMKDLGTKLEQGLIRFNDERQIFEKAKKIGLEEKWRFPEGHPTRMKEKNKEKGNEYLVFSRPFPVARVRAAWEAIQDADAYEAFTCLEPGKVFKKGKSRVERDGAGQAAWGWKRGAEPLTQSQESELIKAGLLKQEEARFQLRDAASGKSVQLHGGSFFWNDYLKRWVMIGVEIGGSSLLGEVWFAQSRDLTGPWGKAVKIVTHDKYSFYNPTQHPFFDQQGGRIIYFEGTYVDTFSGNPSPTPRYNYNQIMYRLDLDDPRLRPAL